MENSVRYEPKDGTVLPIIVITYEEDWVARNISELISITLKEKQK